MIDPFKRSAVTKINIYHIWRSRLRNYKYLFLNSLNPAEEEQEDSDPGAGAVAPPAAPNPASRDPRGEKRDPRKPKDSALETIMDSIGREFIDNFGSDDMEIEEDDVPPPPPQVGVAR